MDPDLLHLRSKLRVGSVTPGQIRKEVEEEATEEQVDTTARSLTLGLCPPTSLGEPNEAQMSPKELDRCLP